MGKKNLSVFKIPYLILLAFLISLLPHSADAETKTFIKEYTYHAGDEDSKNSSRTIALREVKRLLLEELGTYLENQTEVKNSQITKDQIITLTAGIVSIEVIEDKWDGKVYWLKAKIAADPQDVIKSIDSLPKDREKVKELEVLRKKSEELLRENERLNKELKTAKGGRQQEAAQAYKRNINNLSAAEWFERGYKLSISSNNTDAVKAFSKSIELDPQFVDAYFNRGTAYIELRNYQQAIKDFNKAIELNPLNPAIYFGRGGAYEIFGNYQNAINDFNKAIELDPQSKAAYYRGLAYEKLGNYQQAIMDYNKAIELNPRDAAAYTGRGRVYWQLRNYQQAINDSDKAIELDPLYSSAYTDRGIAYETLGNYQNAINDFNKAIELNLQDVAAYRLRGALYIKIGNYQQALNDSNKAIELDPQHDMGYFVRGLAYGMLGNDQQSDDNFKISARLGNKKAQDFLKSKSIVW